MRFIGLGQHKTSEEDYVRLHYAAYRQWNRAESLQFMRYHWILQLGFLLFTVNNIIKGVGWYVHLPSMLILASIAPLSRILSARIPDITSHLWDLFGLATIFSGVRIYYEAHLLYGFGSENAPILVTTWLVCSGSLRSSTRSTIVRNLLLATSGAGLAYFWMQREMLGVLVQFLEGLMAGTFLAHYIIKSRWLRFYHMSLNQEQRYFAYKELAKIVPPHIVRHIEGGNTLESSMPTGWASACVISFDIIGSSKVKHPLFSRAVEELAIACYQIMQENYDEKSLAANAYRIKDTGDGFLCSVGFPYKTPGTRSAAELAIEVSQRFAEKFRLIMSELRYHEPLRCAIGISQGLVEGFFPVSGVKQYDLRGRPLVLATRYEALRNALVKENEAAFCQTSFLIIQEAVYQNLPRHLQLDFQDWDTTRPGHSIRDDDQAKVAYYQLIPCALPHVKLRKQA